MEQIAIVIRRSLNFSRIKCFCPEIKHNVSSNTLALHVHANAYLEKLRY